ncbi:MULTISPECIES: hypothetical protein [unclassified Lysobacter]|uniref:hypothetical protein n=1 Tax=unclassified Lysobacter TaxID=2635362 RepID=UPI001BE7ABDF|nr:MULTISPECIES: hypothetical protein [unclassified Lysobacter]MBT2745217.1 hypothetical protein [Lysobacter sp. ISL-42]MBT2753584.1 hypothetical protein [Lysobacter sp. ISL-50]MBT2779844.1 hypothetical protein [Lysobacter sp. ISL-54]MBT2784485.1 hypothetical protein [Lysobacter sp. ISL-52]
MSGIFNNPTYRNPVLFQQPAEAPPPAKPQNADGVVPPTGTQHEDVQAAVDATLSPDATVEQRNTAYRETQAYVERAASGGDYEVIDDASMKSIALSTLREHDVPTRYRPEVLDAVDREISPSASSAQRMQAYDQIQQYVEMVGGIGDAGITAEALPGRTADLLGEARIPTLKQDAQDDAQGILDVGKRDGEDDYGARRDAFADAVRGEPEAYREYLTAAVLERDHGAVKSWLTPSGVLGLAGDGKIDAATRADITEQIAQAYNDRVIDADSFDGLADIDYGPDQVREYKEITDFLNGSSGPETLELRGNLADRIFDTWSHSQYPTDLGFHSYNFRQLELAINVAGGDAQHPEVLTDFLRGLPSDQLDRVIAIAAQLPQAEPDMMATIFSAVARDERPQAGDLAAQLARLPGEHGDWFEQDQVARNEALAQMLGTHSDKVLDALSEYDDSGARGLGEDTDRKQYEVNGRDLAAVLELTTFNPDISGAGRQSARQAILDYVGDQAQIINDSRGQTNSPGYEDASGRLVVISAASDVAVDRGFEKLQADIDAKKEAIAFVVDLALVAVPLPARLEARATGKLETLFANNPLVQEALTGLTGEVIDTATGQLTDAAKQQLYGNIDSNPELARLTERQAVADAFRESSLGGVADERDRAEIRRDANGLADDISEID